MGFKRAVVSPTRDCCDCFEVRSELARRIIMFVSAEEVALLFLPLVFGGVLLVVGDGVDHMAGLQPPAAASCRELLLPDEPSCCCIMRSNAMAGNNSNIP